MFYQQKDKTIGHCDADKSVVLTFRTFGKTDISRMSTQDFLIWNATYSIGSLTDGQEVAIPGTNLQASCRETTERDCCQNLDVTIKFGAYKKYVSIIQNSWYSLCSIASEEDALCKVFSNLTLEEGECCAPSRMPENQQPQQSLLKMVKLI